MSAADAGARSGPDRASGTPDATQNPVLELSHVPDLGPLYARGVAGSARAAMGRRRTVAAEALPDARVAVGGVTADAARLTEYQHLMGETATDVLPAGFVHVLTFPVSMALMVRQDFPLPLLGMVHVANHVEQQRPVHLGEALDVVVGAERLRPHRAGVTVDLVAEASVGGDVVWRGVSTYLAKGYQLPDPTRSDPTPTELSERGESPGSREPDKSREGAGLTPTGRWRLGKDVGQAYAALSGDRNPIHTSSVAAKAFGFPRAIAHGMYTAARALADVGRARGDAFTWDVEFAKPVLLPSSVAVQVRADDGAHVVTAWNPRSGKQHLVSTVRPLS